MRYLATCHVRGKIPCPRELASFEVGEGDSSPPDGEAVHRAQQVTGELLWLSQRTPACLPVCLLRRLVVLCALLACLGLLAANQDSVAGV